LQVRIVDGAPGRDVIDFTIRRPSGAGSSHPNRRYGLDVRRPTLFAGSTIAFCLLLGMLITATPAVAATPDGPCVYNTDTGQAQCFASEAEAESSLRSAAAAAVVQARLYDLAGHQGLLLTMTGQACTTATSDLEGFGTFQGQLAGLNNRVSSVRTYQHCDVKFYDGFSFSGTSSAWIDFCTNLATCTTANWSNGAGSFKVS